MDLVGTCHWNDPFAKVPNKAGRLKKTGTPGTRSLTGNAPAQRWTGLRVFGGVAKDDFGGIQHAASGFNRNRVSFEMTWHIIQRFIGEKQHEETIKERDFVCSWCVISSELCIRIRDGKVGGEPVVVVMMVGKEETLKGLTQGG